MFSRYILLILYIILTFTLFPRYDSLFLLGNLVFVSFYVDFLNVVQKKIINV